MRISESRIRQIIREEAKKALREASDPRLDSKDIDQPVHKLISGLSAAGVEDVYPEAGELRRFDSRFAMQRVVSLLFSDDKAPFQNS